MVPSCLNFETAFQQNNEDMPQTFTEFMKLMNTTVIIMRRQQLAKLTPTVDFIYIYMTEIN